jgi:hypothetical protein
VDRSTDGRDIDVSEGVPDLMWIGALLENPALFELGALIPQADPAEGGRPRDYPNWVFILYEGLLSVWRSGRRVGAQLSHPVIWGWIRERVLALYPDNPEWHLPEEPVHRYNWTYIHRTYLSKAEVLERIADRFREIAASQAREIGLLDPDGPGSWTHPHRSRVLYGDGKVITPLYKAKLGDEWVDKSTGEVRMKKAELDAALHFEGGEEEGTWGTKFTLMSVRGDEPHSRMILDVKWVPTPGAEAETAMQSIASLRPLVPGAQCVAYDMALKGVHKQTLLRDMGLIPLIKVTAKRAAFKVAGRIVPRVPKDKHVQDKEVKLADGTTKTCRVHAVDGAVGLAEWNDQAGDIAFTKLDRGPIDRHEDAKGKFRWYGNYALPKAYGGGGTLTLRLDQTDADRKQDFNRTEFVSPIPAIDPDFPGLFKLRQDAESINRGLEDTLYIGRAHSKGHGGQHMNLIGYALMVNSLSLHLAKRRSRTGRKPPASISA